MKATPKIRAPRATSLLLQITFAGPVEPADIRQRVQQALGAKRVVVRREKPVPAADPFAALDRLAAQFRVGAVAAGLDTSPEGIHAVIEQVRAEKRATPAAAPAPRRR